MPKILVADDNSNIQKMVTLAFQERGIEVTAVNNGEAAVRRIPDLNPDLVLADVFMPVRNGYEVCEFVKKDQRFSHVPVILLVGAFDPLDEKEARRVGADGVLKKPFVPPDPLIAMVISALEKNPKIAAELAKAREAAAAPPPAPEPVAVEPPALKLTPKPLPEFPEPSAEESAAIYGFGKGVRALDDGEGAALSNEPSAPLPERDEDEEEEVETKKDWRRGGAAFEIPEDAGPIPALTADEKLDAEMFPSERDVPPKHIRVRDLDLTEAPTKETTLVAAPLEKAEEIIPVPVIAEPAPESVAIVEPVKIKTPAPAMLEPVSAEALEAHEPKVAHWMDMMASPSHQLPAQDWMSSLTSSSSASESSHTHAADAPSNEAPVNEAAPAAETPKTFFDKDLVEANAPGLDRNFLVAPPETVDSPAGADPNLVQDVAVRVTPEPLLVSDDSMPSSDAYHSKPRESAVPSFAIAPEPEVAEMPVAAPQTQEVNNDFPRIHPFGSNEPREMPQPEPVEEKTSGVFAEADSSHWEAERMPTALPPNHEALSDIPFLTPPPEPHNADGHVDSDTVDAVVRKVLERLEPQLHDLLSQGVLKPLVENLLQNELTKK